MKKLPVIQFIALHPDELIAEVADKVVLQLVDKFSTHFQPNEPEEYLTIEEVCKLLKRDRSTIWRYTRDKILTGYQIGGSPLYKKSEIVAVLMANKVN